MQALLLIAGYVGVPTVLIVGWTQWLRRPNQPSVLAKVSLAGFLLGTASALLALGSIVYAIFSGGFAYYAPAVLRIYGLGVLLATGGLVLAGIGIFSRSTVRWYALALSFGMLILWLMWMASE